MRDQQQAQPIMVPMKSILTRAKGKLMHHTSVLEYLQCFLRVMAWYTRHVRDLCHACWSCLDGIIQRHQDANGEQPIGASAPRMRVGRTFPLDLQ